MKTIIDELDDILAQTSTPQPTRLFFQLLHEFALKLLLSTQLTNHLEIICKREQEMLDWYDSAPDYVLEEETQLYFEQRKKISSWYALNQIKVFLERYDFIIHDTTYKTLIDQGVKASQFQEEHHELMLYAETGAYSRIFPTVEEYKHYMRRIINALKETAQTVNAKIAIYPFKFDRNTSSLLIGNNKPIKYIRDKNPSLLLGYMQENNWKNMEWDTVTDNLSLDHSQIKRTTRQINDCLPKELPPLLCTPNHSIKPDKKIIALNATYKYNV